MTLLIRPKILPILALLPDNIQARYIHSWLMQNERYKQGRSTAIVLATRVCCHPVIHSLPEEVESVNITLGYPCSRLHSTSLIQTLTELQTLGYDKDRDCYRLRYVNYVLRHPYAQYISSAYAELMSELHDKKIFFPSRKWLCQKEDEGLEILFQEMSSGENFNLSLVQYLLDVLKNIGTQARTLDDPLFQESLFRTYTLVNRLHELIQSGDLIVDIITLQHLLLQLMQTTTIPFHGEPAEGIQIMGVLETRNLDFGSYHRAICQRRKSSQGRQRLFVHSLFVAQGLRTYHGRQQSGYLLLLFPSHAATFC